MCLFYLLPDVHVTSVLMQDTELDNSTKDKDNKKHEAVGFVSKPFGFNYNFKDVITYNLGVGASIKDKHGLQWLYEGHENFGPIPSYAVIPPFAGKGNVK